MSDWLSGFVSCVGLFAATHLFAQQAIPPSQSELKSRPLYHAIQTSLNLLSRTELAREEANLLDNEDQELDQVREQCRTILAQFFAIDAQLDQLLLQSYQQKPSERDKNSWTLSELESLSRNLKVQLARAYRNQALCYPDNSVDRVNSLSLALEQLPNLITQPLDETSVWQARIEQIVCLRLLKNHSEARKQIERWRKASPPEAVASRLLGETLRLDLGVDDMDRAMKTMDAIQNEQAKITTVVPETDDAILETLLAARKLATPKLARSLAQQALEQLQHIAKAHGPYWKRRAEFRLGLALAEQPDSDDLRLLNYTAASLYAAGKQSEAVATYDRIASLLSDRGLADRQFQASKTAAAIVREVKQPALALTRFRKLALQNPQHDEAPSMHLTAIGLAAELAREATPTERAVQFERYLTLLQEHLQQWPEQSSTQQVKQWLARTELPKLERDRAQTLAALGDRQRAMQLYRKLIQDTPNDGELSEAYAKLLSEETNEAELREALKLWQQIERRSKPGGPRWWRGRRARLRLLEQLGEGEQAKKLQQLTKILYPSGVNDE